MRNGTLRVLFCAWVGTDLRYHRPSLLLWSPPPRRRSRISALSYNWGKVKAAARRGPPLSVLP